MPEQNFFSMLTEYGKSVARDVYNNGESVKLSHMAVGYGTQDTGNGGYTPTPEQADLKNEWHRVELNSLSVDPNNPAWLVAEGIIKEDIGGHWISEISVIDNTGGVIAISTWPPTYKPTLPEGSSSAAIIRVVIEVSDTENFELVIDTSLALLTRDEFVAAFNGRAPINSPEFTGVPTAPTPELTDNSTQIATTEYVRAAASEIEEWVTENFVGTDDPRVNTKIMGVRWFKNASPTTLTRLYDSVGLNFSPAVNGSGGSSDFDTMPIYQDIRLCNMVNGVVTAYSGEPGFSRIPASGDVMVEIPKFYYKVVENTDTRDYLISDKQIDDTWLVSPRHAKTTARPDGYDKIYVSAYTLNSSYRSVSGNQSQVSMTRATARTSIHGRGAQYWQYDFATYSTIQLLYLVEVANFDSQRAVGMGNANGTGQINTGGTDNILFHSGSNVNSAVATGVVKYRHMENLWGNLWQFVDGINIQDRLSKICMRPDQYADDTNTNYTALAYANATTYEEYIKALGFDPDFPFAQCPTVTGGADGTFISDCYWSSSGWRLLLVGGAWSRYFGYGLFAFHGNSDSSSLHTFVGCRLLVLP
jgi:hypothetical protein